MNFKNDKIIDILLKDHTTGHNIIWATNDYRSLGDSYGFNCPILSCHIISSDNNDVIKPRVEKSKQEQSTRIKEKAEVFTPSWICNMQNNSVDTDWFGRENVFNVEDGYTWHTCEDKIEFPKNKTWMQYVNLLRMEITCGEAPYLVNIYDAISGEIIPLKRRIGLLDRKLRIITENAPSDEWQNWAECAFKSIYGYEYQGDSLFLARGNLLKTYIEYYINKFSEEPSSEYEKRIAEIISWNIWQMDGLNGAVPHVEEHDETNKQSQISLFGDPTDAQQSSSKIKIVSDTQKFTEIYCKIMDWQENKEITYNSLIRVMR